MYGTLLRLVLYVGIVILPAVVSLALAPDFDNTLKETAKCLALAGFMILVLQVFLAARIKWIEKAFGLDILIRFHKHMAVFGVLLLISHPLLMAVGGAGWHLLIGLDVPWYIWVGKAALVILLANGIASMYQTPLGLKFEKWRLGHDVSAPAILVFAFTHGWYAGDDLELGAMRVLWVLAFVLAAFVFVHHRFLRPLRLKKRPYRVEEVRPEAKDVWTVTLAPPEGNETAPHYPGQFHFITFYRGRGLPVEEHHWTISSSPSEKGRVSSTIKALGDFTSTIEKTRVGDKAAVHGAFGRFSYALHPAERNLAFIAGGIGITPLMSMLRHMRDTRERRSVLLIYANSSEDQVVFREELHEIQGQEYPFLKVVHVLSRPSDNWDGETGHVDREKIQRLCGDLNGKVFYVCGPGPLRDSVIESLRSLGVRDRNIRVEIFSFLD